MSTLKGTTTEPRAIATVVSKSRPTTTRFASVRTVEPRRTHVTFVVT